jgi:hypothetical protein
MLFLVPVVSAQELPWECPPLSAPANATVYRDTDAGLEDTFRGLLGVAEAYVDEACGWVETTTVDAATTTTERVCTTEGRTVTTTEWAGEDRDGADVSGWSGLQIEVVAPAGEPWTRLLVRTSSGSSTSSSWSGGGGDTWRAEWDGAFADLPDDGWFEIGTDMSYGTSPRRSRHVESSGCSWSWEQAGNGEDSSESVSALGRDVRVYGVWLAACPELSYAASVDGAPVGAVHVDTWARNLDDADADGVVATCDCDDADPARSPLVAEIVNDGIDQDCDGADALDLDLDDDGHAGPASGGDDCDDADATVFPGADDPAADGVDGDCDGADDVDADGDGFTADGDRRAPDCDDTNAAVSPTDLEIPYDGVDQDCDGADMTDRDGDGADAEAAGGADCDDLDAAIAPGVPEEACDDVDQDCDGVDCPPAPSAAKAASGCSGSAAWLVLLPGGLLIRRRRGSRL